MFQYQVKANLSVNPGDSVMLWAGPSLGDISKGYVAVLNETQGHTGFSLEIIPQGGTAIIGYSAEWIVERPTVNGVYSNLANYSSATLRNCWAYHYWSHFGPVARLVADGVNKLC